jgi:hypothetical protein
LGHRPANRDKIGSDAEDAKGQGFPQHLLHSCQAFQVFA